MVWMRSAMVGSGVGEVSVRGLNSSKSGKIRG